MDGWTVAWICWGLMFAAIEAPAILNRRAGDTLSEHIWTWFAIGDKPSGWRIRRSALAVFLAWLTAHLLFGL